MKDLSVLERELLLHYLLYHLSMETRLKLMHDMPLIYNKAVGQEVMEVKKKP